MKCIVRTSYPNTPTKTSVLHLVIVQNLTRMAAAIGDELGKVPKERHTTLAMDEIYSAYIYDKEEGKDVNISRFVEDVNENPIILIDDLANNYPPNGEMMLNDYQGHFREKMYYILKELDDMGLYVDVPLNTAILYLASFVLST
ncbi:MAG: hypothetical protein EXX96DRAFT_610803 [Benjaminiella poitrasii]|nr:MAG: hypothetical protein EXX96DRAFT_610803 [Benjaminiella poitrasii]